MPPPFRTTPVLVSPPVPPFLRHFHDAVFPRSQVLPIGLHIHRLRIPPAQSNHRNRLRLGRRPLRPPPAPPQSPVRVPLLFPRQQNRRGQRRRVARNLRHRPKQRAQLRPIVRHKIFGQLADGLVFEEEGFGEGAEGFFQLVG